jgi:hypothetical protein
MERVVLQETATQIPSSGHRRQLRGAPRFLAKQASMALPVSAASDNVRKHVGVVHASSLDQQQ